MSRPTSLSDGELRAILEARRGLPPQPPIESFSVDDYEDSTGDDELKVTALVDNRVSEEQLNWASIEPVVEWIRDSLAMAGERRYVYVDVLRPSDLEVMEEDDNGDGGGGSGPINHAGRDS